MNLDNDSDDKKLWQSAKTFSELCDLTGQFINNDIDFMPAYFEAGVAEETNPLVPSLVELNKSGFMTIDSQPGEKDEDWQQRAFVDGFAMKDTALKLAALTLSTDLFVGAFPPENSSGISIPVVIRDFKPHAWGGFSQFEALENFEGICSADAMSELSQAWFVTIIDLQWGRQNYLWEKLDKVFTDPSEYSIKPHPDLNPDDEDIFI